MDHIIKEFITKQGNKSQQVCGDNIIFINLNDKIINNIQL